MLDFVVDVRIKLSPLSVPFVDSKLRFLFGKRLSLQTKAPDDVLSGLTKTLLDDFWSRVLR